MDDEENIRRLCSEVLKESMYIPIEADNAVEALEQAKTETFDLLITDIRMPEMDGLHLLQKIREVQKELPAVVITGHGTFDRAVECLRTGVQGFVVKPFTPNELLFAVDEALQKSRLVRENIRLRLLVPLLEISRDLLSETNLQYLFETLAKATLKESKSDAVILMMPDPNTGQLEIRTEIGLDGLGEGEPGRRLAEILVPIMEKRTNPLIMEGLDAKDGTAQEVGEKIDWGGIICLPLICKNKRVGLMIVCKKKGGLPYNPSDIELVSILGSHAAIAIENARLFEDLQQANFDSIKALAEALEVKDAYTRGHSDRLVRYAMTIGEKMGLSLQKREEVMYAAILHDIGKIGIREEVLNKPASLTPAEYEEMKSHPAKGAEIVKKIKSLKSVVPLVDHHQERYDGTGYPAGLAGDQIPIGARIVSVLDAFDAMTSNRVYRRSPGYRYALGELKRNAGTQFDPKVVETFLEVLQPEDESERDSSPS